MPMSKSPLKLFIASAFAAHLAACSPIHSFALRSDTHAASNIEEMRARLDAFLRHRGFESLGRSDRMSGHLGCGETATDRTTYEKEWRDTGLYHWIWVSEFTCGSEWRAVVLSSDNAEDQAAELSDELSAEFSQEIASHVLTRTNGYRSSLE